MLGYVSVGSHEFSIRHLSSNEVRFFMREKGCNPSRIYPLVSVEYSTHCYTKSCEERNQKQDYSLIDKNGERRVFDYGRYLLSDNLPRIIESLMTASIYHTNDGSFVTYSNEELHGRPVEYAVYFQVWRTSQGKLRLRVKSAYSRDLDHLNERKKGKKIGLHVILNNRHNNKVINA